MASEETPRPRKGPTGPEEVARVLEAVPFAASTVDMEGRILSANPAIAALVGRPVDDLVGMPVIDLVPAGEREYVEAALATLLAGANDRIEVMHRITRPDGREVVLEGSVGSVRDADDRVLCLVAHMRDVTSRDHADQLRRISEERYRLLFELSPLPMWVVDSETLEFLDVNQAMIARYGWTREELRTMTILDVQPPWSVEAVARIAREAARDDLVVNSHQHRTKDGSLIDVELVIRPMQVAGRAARLAIAQDVTARLRAARETEEAREAAARAERLSALGSLVGGVAHEVRTPLACVSNCLGVLETRLARGFASPRDADEAALALADAREAVDRINDLVKSLRLTIQPPPPRRASARIAEIVLDALRVFRRAEKKVIDVDVDPADVTRVEVDRDEIQRLVINLLRNAVEATPRGGRVRLTLRTGPHEALIAVEDSGAGIPARAQPHVFEPYFTTKPDGLGLGLHIVRRIVEDHGGRISLWSREGEGSLFTVSLPLGPLPRRVPVQAAPPGPPPLTAPQESS